MNNSIFSRKPPKQYVENFVTYDPGLDANPDYFDFLVHGFSSEEAQKMCDLISIEALKYRLEEVKLEYEPTEDEIKEFESYIAERIAEYNKAS